jgi:hypothetical protein
VIAALLFEYLPKPRVATTLRAPDFVSVLRAEPGNGAVLDTVSEPFQMMYHQTVHGKPMAAACGVLSRTPQSAARTGEAIERLLQNGDYARLRDEYGIRYLVTDPSKNVETESGSVRRLFRDSKVTLYELRPD